MKLLLYNNLSIDLSNKTFKHKNPYTIGIEEEYMLCDQNTGNFVHKASEIMDLVDLDIKDRFSFELLESEIEVNTRICENVNDSIKEITKLRNITRDLGSKIGYKIGISGTHPTALPEEQIFIENESYSWVTKQLSHYAGRNITFSIHIHIAVKDENYAIHIANSLRQWIAPLLSLSANSPFFGGEKTGMRSSRTMQFGIFPKTNIPMYFKDFNSYTNLVNKYIESDSIQKPRQIWWKIRPHMNYGTIEFRMCDVQRSLAKTKMLVAICQALVYQSSLDFENNVLKEKFNIEYLNDALWKAARFNMNVKIIDPANNKITTMKNQIIKMQKYIKKALKYFGNENINFEIDNIIVNGTECDEQINIYNKKGLEYLKLYLIDSVDYEERISNV